MVTHTSQRIEFINIGDAVREIERKFSVDPHYRDWKGKKEINIRCPECSVKKFHAHYHLGLNFAKNAYNCYRCAFHGRLSDFLKKNGIRYETKTQTFRPEIISSTAPKIKIPIDLVRHEDIARKAKDYMVSRGFDLKFLKQNFKIWPITNYNHYYFGYIIVALNDYAFYARDFLKRDDKQKHIIRKSDKEMSLYYMYEKNNSETVLVVESMFNLMKAAQYGYDAVCIFGKAHWAGFAEYLKKYNNHRNLCLCFDKDVIIKDVDRFIRRVQKVTQCPPLFYIDPSNMPCNDIAEIRDKETLIKTINKKKSVDEIYLNTMSIGDLNGND
jgi:hypothetical protein